MSASSGNPEQLEERLQRLERNQALQPDVTAELRRADGAIEDLVAAVESLRRRVEALERST